jgi:hypothetical protein
LCAGLAAAPHSRAERVAEAFTCAYLCLISAPLGV